ncbi:aldose epimerase [Lederbergia citrea]|uniref:Aldose epimerase n=1 Tax=Lederbergia citrea TaxID=2833581 RepID=A0A942UTP5_9BACI|nr:aldose epimerase [Lederbergia citrea]MBS4206182.1 aldose epimerase [Lederbergia citrea]MBS4224883.1 aldose epimerase [Lederbergia citrea]
MYKVTQKQDANFTIYEVTDSNAHSWIKVAPERGGIITGFGVHGEELLFLNKKTFYDEEANVRGGIPILFPISGQLVDGKYEWDGKVYEMRNHGFARNYPWEVMNTDTTDGASITLRLRSNEETRKSFPFDFEVIFTYVLQGNTLSIQQEYVNKSESDMPIYPGFHPYFKTSEKNLTYETDAKTYRDDNDFKIKNVKEGLDLSDKKESLVLLDAIKKEIAFELPELNKKVLMKYGEEFKYVYLWTEKGQDFVCVEPWMAMTNEMNRKEELPIIGQDESLKTVITISVE